MAQPTYTARVIALRKTKLGESDLIVTMLNRDGAQLRAVAKGARKPKSPFAVRLELYSECDVLLAKGRSLDIVQEARIVSSNERVRRNLEHTSCAAAIAELVDRTTQVDLDNPKLFALTSKALGLLCRVEAQHAPAITAAHALKTFAFLGVRPQLSDCAICGAPVTSPGVLADCEQTWFSCREGGVVCDACHRNVSCLPVDFATLQWADAFLHATLDEAISFDGSLGPSFAVLSLCREWAREHFGITLKSYDFLFTCGLF